MSITETKTVKFDPGFAQHTTILSISLEYIYGGINAFKNFGQKKMKFKMQYPSMEEQKRIYAFFDRLDNLITLHQRKYEKLRNLKKFFVGFCLGSMLWATYIKSLGDLKIEGNPCYQDTFNKEETCSEIDFSIEYFNQLKKDAKYYLGQDFNINPKYIEILELYREFLLNNMNFVNTVSTKDLKLPESFKAPSSHELEQIHSKIEEVIKSGNLTDLLEVFDFVYTGK